MKTALHGRTFSAEIRFGKCLPHIEQTSLRHRGVSTSRLPGSGFPEPLLMLTFNIGENGTRVKSLRMPGAGPCACVFRRMILWSFVEHSIRL